MLPAERPVHLFPSRFQVNERRGTARAVFNGTIAELGVERIPGRRSQQQGQTQLFLTMTILLS